jgi:Outer membrane protein beta-barrel domain
MKRIVLLLTALAFTATLFAQDDTLKVKKADTLRVGGVVIIRNGGDGKSIEVNTDENRVRFKRRKHTKPSNVSTNWWIVDLGFNNVNDATNYGSPAAQAFLANPGGTPLSKNDFALRTGKSINVNVWFFMQKLNLIKHAVNLKYGLGLELYNYRFKNRISYVDDLSPNVIRDSISFSKNKLATDYITVPFMINFNTSPRRNNALNLSFGVSAGYLYSARNKQISDERGRDKNKGTYNFNRFKLAYIGEIGLGPVRLYGSYAVNDLHENALQQRPYAIGLRFSNW